MNDTTTANVDLIEIDKFAAQAHRWWDPEGEFKPLHAINPLRTEYIKQRAGGLNSKTALDVGCGGGILSESLAESGATVTGIDMGEAQLQVARLHGLESGIDIDYQQIPAETLAAQQPAAWDIVTCMELLEHVPDPAALIAACADLAKPGGDLFFSTINRNPKAYAMTIVGAEYLLRWLPQGTHDYSRFIRPSELAEWARLAGLQAMDVTGVMFQPFTQSWHVSDDVSVNYMMHCRKPV